jgi:hypothetical protein
MFGHRPLSLRKPCKKKIKAVGCVGFVIGNLFLAAGDNEGVFSTSLGDLFLHLARRTHTLFDMLIVEKVKSSDCKIVLVVNSTISKILRSRICVPPLFE